jgi:hypothetical protein
MLWMRFSRVVRGSDTVNSEGWQMKFLNTVHKETKKSSLKNMNMLFDYPLCLNMSYSVFFLQSKVAGGGVT